MRGTEGAAAGSIDSRAEKEATGGNQLGGCLSYTTVDGDSGCGTEQEW